MGKTGTATGAHLHFGIKKGSNWIDPAPYLDADYPVLQDAIIPDCPAGYTQQVFATVTVDELNVRQGPGTSYKAIKTLKKGAVVEILEVDGNWGRFADGWISIKPAYVKIETKLNRIMANIALPILVRGDKGDTVKAAQELLMGEGYDLEGYGADSSFGGATERTVEAFQKKVGIPVTKVIDEATWKALLHIS
jgi:SH3-like domain-containing protein